MMEKWTRPSVDSCGKGGVVLVVISNLMCSAVVFIGTVKLTKAMFADGPIVGGLLLVVRRLGERCDVMLGVDVLARLCVDVYWFMLREPVWWDISLISSSIGGIGGVYVLICDNCILVASNVSWPVAIGVGCVVAGDTCGWPVVVGIVGCVAAGDNGCC